MDINKVIVIGRVGNDPDDRSTDQARIVAFQVATNYRWKDKDGKWHSKTEWHSICAFGHLARQCMKNFVKGSQVYVEGRIQTDEVENKYSERQRYASIIAQTAKWIASKKKAKETKNQNFDLF